MKQQELVNQARDLLNEISGKVSISSKNGLLDINQICEGLVLHVLRIAWNVPTLRSLNAEEKKNFPGIDLADEKSRLAIQVTATPEAAKIKKSIKTFVRHKLYEQYDRLVIFVLTRKLSRYTSKAIEEACEGKLKFDVARDVQDFTELLGSAIHLHPAQLSSFTQTLNAYNSGATPDRDSSAFDPPAGDEVVTAGLLEIFIPRTLYLTDIVSREEFKNRRLSRKLVREMASAHGARLPSDYEVHGNQLLSFCDLEASENPFKSVIDEGTVTAIKPHELSQIDQGQEARFKSLLRLSLQEKLYRERIRWAHLDELFIFLPLADEDLVREEIWQGLKRNTRMVYERKLSKKSADKTYVCKHFAFSTEVLRLGDHWFLAITPDWYFSYGEDYRRSRFADQQLSWLKRREVNSTVRHHFEFLSYFFKSLDTADLFDRATSSQHMLSFGDAVELETEVALNDEQWLPIKDVVAEDPELFKQARLFDL